MLNMEILCGIWNNIDRHNYFLFRYLKISSNVGIYTAHPKQYIMWIYLDNIIYIWKIFYL
jgi:hypothetical protein